MTLNEGQGHYTWYQTIQFSKVYQHSKFERNQLMSIQAKPDLKRLFIKEEQTLQTIHIGRLQDFLALISLT